MKIQATYSPLLLAILLSATRFAGASGEEGPFAISLNGEWQMGFSGNYDTVVHVPGIANDPSVIADEVLWYKKRITLPEGNWEKATLQLKGARFRPRIFVDGDPVGEQEGGMAPLFFPLDHQHLKPGNAITLEIALASLKDVPPEDASHIPATDQWRSNVSSCLWDDVVLHLHGDVSIRRIIPHVNYADMEVSVDFDLNAPADFQGEASLRVTDRNGEVLITTRVPVSGTAGSIKFNAGKQMESWSPGDPNLYDLTLEVSGRDGQVSDRSTQSLGIKSFEVYGKKFRLNGRPFVPRGPTVVWHRWMRTNEGCELGHDTAWFHENIIQRTKDLGGNYLRFHLGLPPERFLDLCDRYGLVVQYEWSFFHGAPASRESLLEQYRSWLDLAMRHPSVSLIHPYNETEGEQLETVWGALDELLTGYPPLVLEDRDVIHVHKYWWSLFENLGLYYDDAGVFPKAIMVDEFGGNYLDEYCNMGGYTTVRETFLRFLGRNHTAEERLAFHTLANARVAEYWRRIGAAGISPFCALGSKQDGNTWFLGPLREGNPKPVWEALAATFSPQSVSIELWDRNFVPGQKISLPVYLFNDLGREAELSVALTVEDGRGGEIFREHFTCAVSAYSRNIERVDVEMPAYAGDYAIKAELMNPPPGVKYPVVSRWDFRVYRATVPGNIRDIRVAVPDHEPELKQFFSNVNITTVTLDDPSADAVVTSLSTWNELAAGQSALAGVLQNAVMSGKPVVMLDAGDRPLGQGYPEEDGDLGPLQGVSRVSDPRMNRYELFTGVTLKFTETAEPESHLHPDISNRELWNYLPLEYTWLWNGYRGGLIVPASDLEFSGLSRDAFIAQWVSRGADGGRIATGPYYSYELQGYYEFSDDPDDAEVRKRLRERMDFLINDAPALAIAMNPTAPISVTDLHSGYVEAVNGKALNYRSLVSCGKNLTRSPVALVDFGPGKGRLLVSQLLTSGRLATGFGGEGLYGVRYDEVAAQFVLNMISLSLEHR